MLLTRRDSGYLRITCVLHSQRLYTDAGYVRTPCALARVGAGLQRGAGGTCNDTTRVHTHACAHGTHRRPSTRWRPTSTGACRTCYARLREFEFRITGSWVLLDTESHHWTRVPCYWKRRRRTRYACLRAPPPPRAEWALRVHGAVYTPLPYIVVYTRAGHVHAGHVRTRACVLDTCTRVLDTCGHGDVYTPPPAH